MRLLVTGGAGFIGSNFIRIYMDRHSDCEIVNLDKLTYAGNLQNLSEVEDDARYSFVKGDICDRRTADSVMRGVDAVVNFAAETHVDRSIGDSSSFIRTDVLGVHILLESARAHGVARFVQVSTDEVYGVTTDRPFTEQDRLTPRNPYSASKAGGDLLALSYFVTHDFPVMITRGANSIGPNQYPEKVVPLFVTNAIDDLPLPLYGSGEQERDYTHVFDHCAGIELVLEKGQAGEIYNIGAGNHMRNIDMARLILKELGKPESLIRHVRDREGHDFRYAIDSTKIRSIGWKPRFDASEAILDAVSWYVENPDWWRPIKSGEFREFYERLYGARLRETERR